MDNKIFFDKYIKSSDMKKYLEDIGYSFNLQEQATIIQNSVEPISIKHRELLLIADEITDLDIKKQILERIGYDDDASKEFRGNYIGYVYALIYQEYELDDIVSGYYGTFEMAYQMGMKERVKFKIEKYQIIYEDTEIILPREISSPIMERDVNKQVTVSKSYSGCPVAGQCFDKNGELIFYWSDELPIERMRVVESLSNQRFENMYVTIPIPFLDGEKVKTIGGKEYHGLIAMGSGFWEERDRKAKSIGAIEDYSDANVIIDITDDVGYGLHIHVNPFLVERLV